VASQNCNRQERLSSHQVRSVDIETEFWVWQSHMETSHPAPLDPEKQVTDDAIKALYHIEERTRAREVERGG
jgi:hypothetical protein